MMVIWNLKNIHVLPGYITVYGEHNVAEIL